LPCGAPGRPSGTGAIGKDRGAIAGDKGRPRLHDRASVPARKRIGRGMKLPILGHDSRVNVLICCGHTLSHFYILMLPTMFLAWQQAFGASFAELGISVAVMSGTTAIVQTPIGFLVDRYGARRFLIGGTLLMTLSVSLMGLATSFWQIVPLAMLSGLGNAVFHPADYAILSGSIAPEKIGRSFAIHTFTGHVGFASAPPVTAALIWLIGWRATLLSVGLVGIPVALAIIWQSRILSDQKRAPQSGAGGAAGGGARMLLSPSIMLFFGFFMVSSAAGAGVQSWLITVLHGTHGLSIEAASSALTGFMVGTMSGVLVGGWVADRSDRHFTFVLVLTLIGSGLMLLVNLTHFPQLATVALLFVTGHLIGASRTPRDVMVKDAAPPGQIGKVFGFVSAGLALGGAVMPVPYGMLIDAGRADLVLVVVAGLWLLSLLFAGSARANTGREPLAVPAE
jgi:MFS transporter, FSR family, fosmidomycin resistance protein